MKAFYARRILRIFPLFYLVLALAYWLHIPPVRDTWGWHVLYLSNFYFFDRGSWHGPISHFWSLAVEEQFYLVWPALVLFVRQRHLVAIITLLIIVGVASRLLIPWFDPPWKLWTVLPQVHLDALGFGALIAYLVNRNTTSTWFRFGYFAAPLAILIFAGRHAPMTSSTMAAPIWEGLEHWSLLVFFGWLILFGSIGFQGPIARVLEYRWLVYLGRISYGIYLLHNFAPFPVRLIAERFGLLWLDAGVPRIIMLTIVTLLAAATSWHYFEAPISRLKERFPYRRRNGAQTKSSYQEKPLLPEPSVLPQPAIREG